MTAEPGWARARRAFRSVFGASGNVRVELGRAKYIGGGLHALAFAAHVDLVPYPGRASGPYVALVPQRGETAAFVHGMRREAAILDWLQGQRIPLQPQGPRPSPRAAFPDGGGLLSFEQQDGFVHTLNTAEGLARKLADLQIG